MSIIELAFKPVPEGWEDIFEACKNELFQISQNIPDISRCYPKSEDIFKAFNLTDARNVKVIIIGQDPYPSANKARDGPVANGLSFSVNRGEDVPPSLGNIYRELAREYPGEFTIPKHGDLSDWAKQGVLLLNSSLTFDPTLDASSQHFKRKLWLPFVIKVLKMLKQKNPKVVFITWGNSAHEVFSMCKFGKANLLASAHPSSRAYGKTSKLGSFEGNGHFVECNKMLAENGHMTIDWSLD